MTMVGRTSFDAQLRRLLQPLMSVRHAHLRPLEAVTSGVSGLSLHYGEPEACVAGCEGLVGAIRALHAAGLWVGDLSSSLARYGSGRVILSGVGSTWELRDPFRDHPSATTADLRVAWRQRSDRDQLGRLAGHLVTCA
ncbi:MAG TPA: hypothetical protein PKL68_11720 [Actinomycetota bacterium]|jgi:hypothetical protein|nr:hypothetical protein [Actinomycetota bacterium]